MSTAGVVTTPSEKFRRNRINERLPANPWAEDRFHRPHRSEIRWALSAFAGDPEKSRAANTLLGGSGAVTAAAARAAFDAIQNQATSACQK